MTPTLVSHISTLQRTRQAHCNQDPEIRGHALLLHGPPVAHMPTGRIFAYATHFDAKPMGLEWINDDTCVLVFETRAAARASWPLLQRHGDEPPDEEGFVTAHIVPQSLWPAKARVDASLGTHNDGAGLKAPLLIRWARHTDVKARGAAQQSEFYRKHGENAGKEVYNPETGRAEAPALPPRRRVEREQGRRETRDRESLDDDLDSFLAERDRSPHADADIEVQEDTEASEPATRMRADALEEQAAKRARVDRTSERVYTEDTRSRSRRERWPRGEGPTDAEAARPDGRRRERGGRDRRRIDDGPVPRRERPRRPEGDSQRTEPRPRKTQQELDDELDSFLQDR
jgi:hypothetical protein